MADGLRLKLSTKERNAAKILCFGEKKRDDFGKEQNRHFVI